MKKKKGKRPKPYRYLPLAVAFALFACTLGSCQAGTPQGAAFAVSLVLMLGGAVLSGCVGAPKSRADFEAMETDRYENWKARLSVVYEEAAYAMVAHSAANVETVDRLRAAMLALGGAPLPPSALDKIASEYGGILRLAVLELSAFLGQTEIAPTPRLVDLLTAVGDGLERGKLRALAEAGPAPTPDPETGP